MSSLCSYRFQRPYVSALTLTAHPARVAGVKQDKASVSLLWTIWPVCGAIRQLEPLKAVTQGRIRGAEM